MTHRGLIALTVLPVALLLGACGAPGDGTPQASVPASTPASTPSASPSASVAASVAASVRVIVELDDAAFADDVLAAFPDARNVRRTQYSPLIILELPESRLEALRRQPHVERVTLDTADPPSG